MTTTTPAGEGGERQLASGRAWLPNLSLGISERRLLLGALDGLGLNMALTLAMIFRQGTDSVNYQVQQLVSHPWWFVTLTLIWFIVARVLDCYDLKKASNPFAGVLAVVKALAVTCLIYLFVPYISPPLPSSRFAGLLLPLFALGFLVAWRVFYAVVFIQPMFQRRVLVVGAGRAGIALIQALQEVASSDYHVCGFVDDDATKKRMLIEGAPILGPSQDLLSIARREEVSEVIVAITHMDQMEQTLFQAIMDCQEQGIHITAMPTVYENITGRVAVEYIGRRIHLFLPPNFSSTHRIYEALKRGGDVIGSLVGLALFALSLPCIALAINLDSPGPLFYSQERVGKGGRIFKVIKLRSMVQEAEEGGQAVWATKEDDRITRVGRFLRRTRLDEFPQFVNVLKGEMSLIGPRPERPQFVTLLTEQIPFYRARHAVKPGLTGWAQIKYRYGNTVEDALVKLQYDLYYIKHRSLYLDLFIAARTVLVMLTFQGT
ncbi:MAG: sugar transferase [Chloroflexi bacterium]|nr:sugar transferase [Chloroflexota bacterium]MBU1749944.1 sugar transferase [Chloroflexota bacterium]